MTTSTRSDILGYSFDKGIKKVHIKSLGKEVYVKLFSFEEQKELSELEDKVEGRLDQILTDYIIRGVCDENGVCVFTKEDKKALENKPAKLLFQLARAVNEHNQITEKDIEDEAKNS